MYSFHIFTFSRIIFVIYIRIFNVNNKICLSKYKMKKRIYLLFMLIGMADVGAFAQGTSGILLFPATPNPATDKCLVRMYLPKADDHAALRIVDRSGNVLREISLSRLVGIQSQIVQLADLPAGPLTCQLFYLNTISQSTTINHVTDQSGPGSYDTTNLYKRLWEVEAKVKNYELSMGYLRDYNFFQDSLITIERRAHSSDSLNKKIVELNREVIRLRLKLESFEQLVRELAVLRVTNKLSDNPMRKGNTYTLTRIYFESSNSDFLEKSKRELDDLIGVLKEFPSLVIKIKGHTDNVGTYGANMILSKERAKNVYSYLIERGIEANRLVYEGYGSNQPLTENLTEEDRAINRRVEFVILKE